MYTTLTLYYSSSMRAYHGHITNVSQHRYLSVAHALPTKAPSNARTINKDKDSILLDSIGAQQHRLGGERRPKPDHGAKYSLDNACTFSIRSSAVCVHNRSVHE
jgi:hypothetical protein